MTHEQYIQCVIATLLGNVLHVLIKILSLSKDHKVANIEFSLISYFKDDKWALITDLVSSFVLVFVVEEWLDFDTRIAGKIKSIFVFVGFTGSYVIMQLMSVATDKLRKAIDYKTNIADKQTGTLDKPTPK